MENLKKSDYVMVMITASNEDEAAKLGHGLVEKRLVACVNLIQSIRSIYRWKGKLYDEKETMILAKTKSELFEKVKNYIKNNHSYEVPEVISLPISSGLSSYMEWIDENTTL